MPETITFEAFREQWLEDIRSNSPSLPELNRRFTHKMFTQWRDIGETSEDLIYCDGANDGGIDLAYLERGDQELDTPSGDTWYVVQSKFGSGFQGSGMVLQEGRKFIETLETSPEQLSEAARDVHTGIEQFRKRALSTGNVLDRLVWVLATEMPLTMEQKRSLDEVRAIGRERLGPIFDVEAVSIETIYLNTLDEIAAAAAARLKVPLKAQLAASGDDLWIGSVSLSDLYDFLKEYRSQTGDLDQLYAKNVRLFLGGRRKVNKGIQQTLSREPEHFGLYNNGITFVVTQFEPKPNGVYRLVEPYIVNGCQTTRTIWEVFQSKLDSGGRGMDVELEAWKTRAQNAVAVVKVVQVGAAKDSEALLQNITRYTNSQNAVSEKDFITLEDTFQRFKRQMENQFSVFLEIQRGGWDSRQALQKQNPTLLQFRDNQWANAFDLLKVYGSGWLRGAGTAFGRNAAFVPGGPLYRKIIQESEEGFGAEDLYAAHLLHQAADQNDFGRGSRKNSRKQTRYLFYMIVLDLLRDVLIRANLPATLKSLTAGVIKLSSEGNRDASQALIETAVGVVDEYLTAGAEDSVFTEPAFKEQFNYDLNGFLKWDRLGQADSCPSLNSLLAINKRTMGRGQPSPRELVAAALR